MNEKVLKISEKGLKKDLPKVSVGDTVKVTVRIKEGNKERNQNYEGVVIKLKGSGVDKSFTVRRIFQNVGVERVFLMNSPKIEKIKVLRSGKAKRSKLYYLRERTGKATRLKEKRTYAKKEVETNKLPDEKKPEEGKLVEATSST